MTTMLHTISHPRPFDAASVGAEMLAAPIVRAMAISGLSRSAIYRAAAAGDIRLLKVGRSTLVDMASVRAFLASLPTASIRAPQQAA
jgi:hypothetical protein